MKIFAPKEGFGVFGASLPGTFYRQDASLPDYMRYYDGKPPQMMSFGTPWPRANFVLIEGLTEAAPGISVIATVSQTPGTLELRELSLAIETPKGLILVVGCSHPGIERIVEAATARRLRPLRLRSASRRTSAASYRLRRGSSGAAVTPIRLRLT